MATDVNAVDQAAPVSPVETDTEVEVHSDFSGRWVSGFAVEETSNEGYRLRRKSDTVVLPDWFSPDEVRVDRR